MVHKRAEKSFIDIGNGAKNRDLQSNKSLKQTERKNSMHNAMSHDKDPVQIVSVASTTEYVNQLNQNIFDSNDAHTKHLNQFLNDSSAPNLFNTYKAHTEAPHTRTEDGGSILERDAHTTNTLNHELTELERTYENQKIEPASTIGSLVNDEKQQFAVSPF